jgi:GT2 family glycosyltransferase
MTTVQNCAWNVLVYDNGFPLDSQWIVEPFKSRIDIEFHLNEAGHGLGYSLLRGTHAATGEIIVELNDDAMVPVDFLTRLVGWFALRQDLGVLGFRAIETGYFDSGGSIGTIDPRKMEVEGNFNRPIVVPIEVDHVYGFCYAYRRKLLAMGGCHDRVLLSRDYSSGNRIETDHCMSVRKLGYKVIYDSSIAIEHLAKPRGDLSERSDAWRINAIRNTLYLFLKHFGLFGNRAIALRFTLLHDMGLKSVIFRPSVQNWHYFMIGCRARFSAFQHYLLYLLFYRHERLKTPGDRS